METTQQKLDHLVSLGEQLNDWDRGFVESVADQYKQRNLSYGQVEVVNKILAKHSPEQIKARNAWRASYDEEKQALTQITNKLKQVRTNLDKYLKAFRVQTSLTDFGLNKDE